MKTFIALTLLFCTFSSLCQPFTSNGSLYPASYRSDYNMTEKTEGRKLMAITFTDKQTNNPVFQYNRQDDSSFLFTEFDQQGNEIRKGLLTQNNAKAMSFKIVKPDLAKDPELKLGLVKDSIIYDEYFERHGLWKEMTPDKKSWQGTYDHQLKTGIWKRVNPAASQPGFEIDSMILYQNDVPLKTAHSFSSAGELFPLLQGNWCGDREHAGRIYQVLYRQPTALLQNDCVKFSSPDKLEIVSAGGTETFSWTFENNQLLFKKPDAAMKVSVVYLDDTTLIVRHLLH